MSLKLKNTEKYLEQYAKTIKEKLIEQTERKDRTRSYKSGTITSSISTSGKLVESYKFQTSRKTEIVNYNIIGNEYGEAVDEGTTSSKPPVSKLINWLILKNKTLKDSKQRIVDLSDIKKVRRIAFAIQKSLNIIGIQKTGFITDLVNQEFKQLNDIYKPVVKDIEVDIDNILFKAGYKSSFLYSYYV